MRYSVVTAEGTITDGEAASLTIPTKDGEITVLPNHIPLVSVLVPGLVTVRPDDGDDQHLAVSGGFVNVAPAVAAEQRPTEVVLLADAAERADEIDLEQARQAKQRAEEVMGSKLEKQELAEASAALQKSLARLRAAELIQHRRRRGGRS